MDLSRWLRPASEALHVRKHLLPDVDNQYNLGASDAAWKDAYFDGAISGDAVTSDSYNASVAKVLKTDSDGGLRVDHGEFGNHSGATEGQVFADLFCSVYRAATASTASGSFATVYTLPYANENHMYLVSADTGYTGDAANYGGYAVIYTDGAQSRLMVKVVGSLFDIGMAGTPAMAIQLKQSSGGARVMYASIVRIH